MLSTITVSSGLYAGVTLHHVDGHDLQGQAERWSNSLGSSTKA